MDGSTAVRVADTPKEDRPDHLANLPEETHVVTGHVIGNGTTELATEKAKISGKIVKLERNASGGIDYQIAIFVSEPTPVVTSAAPVEDPQFLAAVDYFIGKGLANADARKKVNQFGVQRVLAAKDRDLDNELDAIVKEKGESA